MSLITPEERLTENGHTGGIVWLTGLSGSGKSTLSQGIERELFYTGFRTLILDGDILRNSLNSDLEFSKTDRSENVRRVSEIACLLAQAGLVIIVALISPFRCDRANARTLASKKGCKFVEIYVDAPVATCQLRDPKGIYRRARLGLVTQLTGIDAPYEVPESAEIHVRTAETSAAACVSEIIEYLLSVFKT